ncbi:MAG TPA: NAD(P)/FAD-dependent oxidoreductase, partial [Burkholderiaceae bacterium]|nr:NAD(P)/FAD-dependent oxidoreductase [Burkholderiaceae bacterium]
MTVRGDNITLRDPQGCVVAHQWHSMAVGRTVSFCSRRGSVMRTMLRAIALLLPLILIGTFAPPHLAGGTWLCGGVLMIILVARGQSWTAWASAPDWPGMTHDALFARINAALSVLWGGIFVVSGLALLLGGGPVYRWVLMPLGGLVSAVLPRWWSGHALEQRLRDADPNPWPSPLHAPAAADLDMDVAVVGAGIGGLTAAAMLAQAGQRVAVFEQHDKPGGFCHCWEGVGMDGGELVRFRFDAGVHDISGWFEGGTVREVLRRLNLDSTLEWRRLDHAFVAAGQRWDPPRGWDAFTESLAARHPTMAPALRSLLADVRTLFDAMYATSMQRGGVPGLPRSVDGLKAFAREHPLAVRWMPQPFGELLAHHGVTGPARVQLLALSGYVTHDPATLRVRHAVPLLGYFLHGGHYPVGGSGALAQALADSLALDGGALHLSTPVSAVELAPAGTGVQAVRLADGRCVRCRAVVMNGDAIAAQGLLQPAGAIPPALRSELAALRPATSMFAVHLGVRGAPAALPPVVHLHDEGLGGTLEIVLPSTVDASAAPPGYFTVELMRLVQPSEMAGWFDDASAFDPVSQRQSAAYQARKLTVADPLIDAAETLIPGLRARTVFRREASPVTFRRYGYSTLGAVYGALGPDGRPGALERRSQVPGLVFAGSAAAG